MDTRVPRARRSPLLIAAIAAGLLLLAIWAWKALVPSGLRVDMADVRVGNVELGLFNDEIVVRTSTEALNAVILDAVEAGRVEEVIAEDGAMVQQGDLLFRLSNPQRRLDVLQRQTEVAQQVSNLLNLRVALEASKTEHRRRLAELEFALTQARKQHARNLPLAAKGSISDAALQISADTVAYQERLVAEEGESATAEQTIRRNAVEQMESTIAALEAGLQLENEAVDALALRAPVGGRLTDFQLHVGESVKQGQNIGRIDDPSAFKLTAQIDQFYLSRVSVGQRGTVQVEGTSFSVEVARVYSQIKDGRFTVEMSFNDTQPLGLSPGGNLDVKLSLGESSQALVVPNGPFYNDSGGAWVFVVSADGNSAERRQTRFGRRNNSQIEVLAGLSPGEQILISEYAPFGKAERLVLIH